jgi:hypothetical protein
MKPLLALLLLAGCAVQRLEAARPPPCEGSAPECRQAQEIRAEACRHLAATGPAEARRSHLACAVAAYQVAVGPAAPRPLLLNLAAAAQAAIAEGAGDPASNAAAMLLAAEGLRHAASADPEGCRAAQSARLTLALLAPVGAARCGILAAVPAACRTAKPVTGQAAQLAAALNDQHRSHGCP